MTTIVCTRSGMAADRRATGIHIMRVTKIHRVNGALIGVSGNMEQALRFIEWRRNPEQRPSFAEQPNFAALELTIDGGILYWGAELIPIPVENDYFAIGSGSPYALGALAMGATPKEAIKVATKWDEATGSEIQSVTLKGK